MDFMGIQPQETVESIFLRVDSKDVLRCSLASLRWRESLNSNRIWSRVCSKEKYKDKEYLTNEMSYFSNPNKRFKPVANLSERMSDLCHWRSHYDRYKYLEFNWRRGRFALHRIKVPRNGTSSSWYSGDSVLVIKNVTHFLIYSLEGRIRRLPNVIYKYLYVTAEKVLVTKEHIVYTQNEHVIGLKFNGTTYEEQFDFVFNNSNSRNLRMIMLVRGDQYLIVADAVLPNRICFFNMKTMTFDQELSMQKKELSFRTKLVMCTALVVYEKRLFIALSTSDSDVLCIYDISKWEWVKEISLPSTVSKFHYWEGMLCAHLTGSNGRDVVYVWSLGEAFLLSEISVDGNHPVLIAEGALLHYHECHILVTDLVTGREEAVYVGASVLFDMRIVGDNLLLINTGESIEVWDWIVGEKLYVPYRGASIVKVWANHKTVVVETDVSNFIVIGFW